MSGTAISVLALPRFLEVALIRAGYSHLDDLDGIDADELATGTYASHSSSYARF